MRHCNDSVDRPAVELLVRFESCIQYDMALGLSRAFGLGILHGSMSFPCLKAACSQQKLSSQLARAPKLFKFSLSCLCSVPFDPLQSALQTQEQQTLPPWTPSRSQSQMAPWRT